MTTYSSEIEQRMQRLYKSLNEKDRRRYAAIEAAKLGWGWRISYISILFGCNGIERKAGQREGLVVQETKEKPCAGAQGQVSYLDELKQGNDEPQYKGTVSKNLSIRKRENSAEYPCHRIDHRNSEK